MDKGVVLELTARTGEKLQAPTSRDHCFFSLFAHGAVLGRVRWSFDDQERAIGHVEAHLSSASLDNRGDAHDISAGAFYHIYSFQDGAPGRHNVLHDQDPLAGFDFESSVENHPL